MKRDQVNFVQGAAVSIADLAALAALPGAQVMVQVWVTIQPPPEATAEPWRANARLIGQRLLRDLPGLAVGALARAVHAEMSRRRNEPGMTGRSGRVPSASTIKRHALAGLTMGHSNAPTENPGNPRQS